MPRRPCICGCKVSVDYRKMDCWRRRKSPRNLRPEGARKMARLILAGYQVVTFCSGQWMEMSFLLPSWLSTDLTNCMSMPPEPQQRS